MTRSEVRRYTRALDEYLATERWVDSCILYWLSKSGGARLEPDEEAKAWIGEALCKAADERRPRA